MGGLSKNMSRLFVIVGLILIMIGIYWISMTFIFINSAIRTNGTIVDLVKTEGLTAPVFLFETKEGTPIKIKSNTSSVLETFMVGNTVEIYYDPNNPYNAKINSFVQLWFFPTILNLFGFLFVILISLKNKKLKAKRDNELI